jgi:chromosome segregation ATPase
MELEAKSELSETALPGKDGEDWFMDLLDAAKRELTTREYRIGQLERQLELAQIELERARDYSSKMEMQVGSQEEHIASLSIRIEEMGEQVQSLENALSQADLRMRADEKIDQFHEGEIRRLEAENAALALSNDEQARRIRALDQIIDGYVESNARIRSDFDKLRAIMRRPSGMTG